MKGENTRKYKSKKRYWVVTLVALFVMVFSAWYGMKTSENVTVPAVNPFPSSEIKTEQVISQTEPNAPEKDVKKTDSGPIGERTAQIRVGAENIRLTFNARGELPRLKVPSEATIAATVRFPNAMPGQPISVQPEDGGTLIGDAVSGVVLIDDQQQANFEFQPSANDGQYRVTLRNGGESRVLEFWVGPEPPVLVRK